jgi:peptidyl-tRNA hydrolase
MEEVKLVLVVNDSLKMQKGKIAAQAGHATLACALMLKDANPRVSTFCKRMISDQTTSLVPIYSI